ncbi:MAG: hypothetical protein HYR98_02740 [Nitrospirae bacterium]|nr:hypothetical protein [Nitrospirota bacterium]
MKAQLKRTICAVAAAGLIGLGGCATTPTKAEAPRLGGAAPAKSPQYGKLLGAPTAQNWVDLARVDVQWSWPRTFRELTDNFTGEVEGKFYNVSTQSDWMDVVDPKTGKVLKKISLDKASLKTVGIDSDKFKSQALPHHAYVVPGGRYIYVGNESREHDALWVVDTQTDRLVKILRMGYVGKEKKFDTGGPLHGSFSPTEPIFLIGNVQDSKQGLVTVIDAVRHEVAGHIKTTGVNVRDVIITRDGKWAYVGHQGWNPDKGQVAPIDLVDMKTRKVVKTFSAKDVPFMTMTYSGKYIVGSSRQGQAVIIDTAKQELIATVDLGTAEEMKQAGKKGFLETRNLEVHPNDSRAYIGIRNPPSLAIVDLKTFKLIKRVPAGEMTNTIYVGPNPKYQKLALITNEKSDFVSVIEIDTDTPKGELYMGSDTHNIAYSANGRYGAVSVLADDKLAVVDFDKELAVSQYQVGWGSKGIRWVPYMPGLSSAKPYQDGTYLSNTAKK